MKLNLTVLLIFILFASSCSVLKLQPETCAKEGWQFSTVLEEYPESCCKGLIGWNSGMDTSIAIGDSCYETGAVAGSPVGTCINCGNSICDDIENVCNCHEDCADGINSRYQTAEEFCSSSAGKRILEECSLGMKLPICELCRINEG